MDVLFNCCGLLDDGAPVARDLSCDEYVLQVQSLEDQFEELCDFEDGGSSAHGWLGGDWRSSLSCGKTLGGRDILCLDR